MRGCLSIVRVIPSYTVVTETGVPLEDFLLMPVLVANQNVGFSLTLIPDEVDDQDI